jgi:thiosulfate/3-mercaptopyruvate sulfurtransferase
MRMILAGFLFWMAADFPVAEPKDIAATVAKSNAPAVLYVGPNVLFRSKHIPGSVYAGPGAKAEGLELLKAAVGKLPKDREIVLYCGCCPWDHCPNIKPAMEMLKGMGYTHAKAMYIPENFKSNWIDKGYPVE